MRMSEWTYEITRQRKSSNFVAQVTELRSTRGCHLLRVSWESQPNLFWTRGHQSPLKAALHFPCSVCHHSNPAEGQLDKNQLISKVSDNTLLGPLLFNCPSQNFLKTETVKANKWSRPQQDCSVHLHSATVLDVQGHSDEFRTWSSSAFSQSII